MSLNTFSYSIILISESESEAQSSIKVSVPHASFLYQEILQDTPPGGGKWFPRLPLSLIFALMRLSSLGRARHSPVKASLSIAAAKSS